ncbi:hypothetical protein [Cellulophaga sp. L1A9]|uniref:hypothetical protein n=1 Tax=Cellulophaga sp. L1A9 TaxID=2686362 RepID=UPI00131E72BE|nr:hypothetical protein [Cellulophaga sp. L1A9]
MQKILLGLLLLISPLFLLAHNPLSAMYRLETKNDGGVLHVFLTQAAVNKALVAIHGTDVMNTVSEKEFKELIVSYIKENFKLAINNVDIQLKKGGIRYGSHETDLTFITSEIPTVINNVALEITSFKNNEYHQTIFYLRKNDGTNEKIILNSKNNFKTKIDFEKKEDYSYFVISSIIAVAAIGLVMIGFKFRKKKLSH